METQQCTHEGFEPAIPQIVLRTNPSFLVPPSSIAGQLEIVPASESASYNHLVNRLGFVSRCGIGHSSSCWCFLNPICEFERNLTVEPLRTAPWAHEMTGKRNIEAFLHRVERRRSSSDSYSRSLRCPSSSGLGGGCECRRDAIGWAIHKQGSGAGLVQGKGAGRSVKEATPFIETLRIGN